MQNTNKGNLDLDDKKSSQVVYTPGKIWNS